MTATQSLKLYELLFRQFQNEADAKSFVNEIENIVEDVKSDSKETYATKNEFQLLRKDIELTEGRITDKIQRGQLELKTEINKLIIWIVATFFTGIAIMLAIVKLFSK